MPVVSAQSILKSFWSRVKEAKNTAELHVSEHWLYRLPIIQIGLALWINLSVILQNLPWNYWLSDQVQYSVMASRTSNEAWSKCSGTATCCK